MTITLDEKDIRDYQYRLQEAFRKLNEKAFAELLGESHFSPSAKRDLQARYNQIIAQAELPKLVEI